MQMIVSINLFDHLKKQKKPLNVFPALVDKSSVRKQADPLEKKNDHQKPYKINAPELLSSKHGVQMSIQSLLGRFCDLETT